MQSVQVCREARQLGSTRDPRQVGEGCQGSGVGNEFQHSKEKDMETDSIEDWKTRALAAECALAQIKDAKAVAYLCPVGCGCTWRDNGDGSMSLFGHKSQSCQICEYMPLAKLLPLYAAPQPPAGKSDQRQLS